MRSVLLSLCLVVLATAKMQNVTVKGTTICKTKRYPHVKVQLYEKDTFDPDDLLAEVQSDSEGNFEIKGGEDETFTINPYLVVTHQCESKQGCVRVMEFEIPKEKINNGVYDMTYVPLNIRLADEREKCTKK